MNEFSALSDEQLGDQITTWAGRIAAGEARLLALISEFDRREAWAGPGLLSCAHWLSWRLGLGLAAAYERVRVARALRELPLIRAAFEAGGVSWSQVRAVTRVATAADEQTYVDIAQHATGAQLERLVRGVRRAQKISEDERDPALAAHRMRARTHYDEDGTLVLTVRVPAEQGAVLLAALEQARAVLDGRAQQSSAEESAALPAAAARPVATPTPTPTPTPTLPPTPALPPAPAPAHPPASLGDAVQHLAVTFLDQEAAARPAAARRGRSRLVVQVDPLTGWGRLHDGEFLPPSSLRAALQFRPRSFPTSPPTEPASRDLGRTRRLPSQALRDMLGAVDGERCRFPGCTRNRRLHAHHVQQWSAGGRTDLANLLLLCPRHHTLVHAQGFRLALSTDRTLEVRTRTGARVLHHPTVPWQDPRQLDPLRAVDAATLPPTTSGDRLDLGYAVMVLRQQAA